MKAATNIYSTIYILQQASIRYLQQGKMFRTESFQRRRGNCWSPSYPENFLARGHHYSVLGVNEEGDGWARRLLRSEEKSPVL